MKFRNRWFCYQSPASGDEGGGNAGGGDGGAGADPKVVDPAAAAAKEGGKEDGKEDGKEKLSDTEAKLLREVMQNKQGRKEAEAQVAELKAQLKKFEGIDLEEVTTLLQERREAADRKLVEQGNWDALKAQMAEQHAAQLEALQTQLEALQTEKTTLISRIEEMSIGSAFSNSAYIQNELVLTPSKTRVVFGQHFEVEDGKVVAYDKPRGAAGRVQLVDSRGEPLGFDEALRRLVEADPERDELVRARAKPGAGSGSEKQGAGKQAGQKQEHLHGVQRINRGLGKLLADVAKK